MCVLVFYDNPTAQLVVVCLEGQFPHIRITKDEYHYINIKPPLTLTLILRLYSVQYIIYRLYRLYRLYSVMILIVASVLY